MANSKLRLGILLPTRGLLMTSARPNGASQIISMAEKAEDAGLDSVWVGDSLTAKPRMEPITTLAALAARTQRVRLGTAVLLAALRHPVHLAHTVGTVDMIAEGRTVLAIGLGGAFNSEQRAEWAAVGVETRSRAGRLEELLEITKRLTAGEEVSYQGRHFQIDSVHIEPSKAQVGGVPILLACHGRAGQDQQLQRAVRLGDGFISISDRPDEFLQMSNKVRSYAIEQGKNYQSMEAAFYLTVNLGLNEVAAKDEAERYLTSYYGSNIWGDRWGPFGCPERTLERIKEYARAGAGTFIIRFASFDQEGQLDIFLREVVPWL